MRIQTLMRTKEASSGNAGHILESNLGLATYSVGMLKCQQHRTHSKILIMVFSENG